MMICNYNENLLRRSLKNTQFLGEFRFIAQQQFLGFRPDLIFCNKEGRVVIVEIQLKLGLTKLSTFKSLEYRDLYKISYNITDVQVLLLCNTIEEKYLPILETHSIQCIVFDETKFIEHFQKIASLQKDTV